MCRRAINTYLTVLTRANTLLPAGSTFGRGAFAGERRRMPVQLSLQYYTLMDIGFPVVREVPRGDSWKVQVGV